ncbi:hypothetical protein RhiirA1_462593 [Rhizophagus irregularis]|uniref:Uncharacterized protein n=1 Tax=Rhizophagus irregularis TaxID=588596 RepID=A0A2N0RM08_9GLOM|nr:hypothetical protein RhiirA1_462593 [Rhizophagus irregularis]
MAGIATRYVTENELNNEMSIEELSKHAPALDILLTDKVKRDQARRRLKKGYNFSEEQVFALIPKLTAGRKKGGALPNAPDTPDITQEVEPDTVNTCQISPKETIRDLAQRIIRDNLSEVEVKLRTLKASEKIISATLIPDITRSANKIQKERSKQCEDEGIDFPDHFSLESVKERLDIYDVSRAPGLQALADVTIMLCIRPAEIKTLRISNGGVTGYAKNRGQQDIPRFNTFLKKDEFLPETGKPLLPSSLRKLEAVFAVVSHGAKNLSEAMTIASEGLRHSPDNYASPAKNYTIVNYRKRGQPYDQAKAIKIFDEN